MASGGLTMTSVSTPMVATRYSEVELANRDSQPGWREFLLTLKQRGLRGVELAFPNRRYRLEVIGLQTTWHLGELRTGVLLCVLPWLTLSS
jgi:hypothetical protein